MVDARFPERLLVDRRLLKLSPVDFRSYCMATIWCVSNRTDGCLMPDDLALIPKFDEESTPKLIAAELWSKLGAGFLIVDFEAWQTSRGELEQLEKIRAADREKKRRQRATKRDVSPGRVPGTAQEGQEGQEGQGFVQQPSFSNGERVTDWPTAVPGQERKTA